MNIRQVILEKTALVWLLLVSTTSCTNQEKKEEKPNIIFILTDDQQWNTIRALGNEHIHTPNIDRIAENSLVFENAYCYGGNSGAVCIPSRNMIMTGQTFHRFEEDCRKAEARGEKPRKRHYANPQWPTIPKAMKEAGYQTFYREKSGSANNPEIRKQFDDYADIHQVKALRSGRPARGIVDQAIKFMAEDRDPTKPFFMYLGVPAPHDPRWSLKRFRDMYDKDALPIPENYLPVHPWNIGSMTVRDEKLEAWPRTKEAIQRHIHDYYSTITATDYDLGRLLDFMEQKGFDKNTIIIFSSDQGLALGQHGLMGKQNIYEGTMKVPFIVKGPGVIPGKSKAFVYLHDILPTLCDLAQTETPKNLDGKSFAKLLKGENFIARDYLTLAYMEHQRSIRDDRWKLIRFPKIDKHMFFDLQNDPHETTNLAGKTEHTMRIATMMRELDRQRLPLGDSIPLFPEHTEPAEFIAPTKKLKTTFPAGGLAPEDPLYVKSKK
ncbi:sulfatase [Fulvitalea axinellae]|uniref:Sulfatase n=1 Tax=Fulvitalea axinellae TaxID=1182444 RepID=A0AAU9CPT5_9BACT|nr:sulfatase [Fulvitalea axinellae]